jgi:hypothetical protein
MLRQVVATLTLTAAMVPSTPRDVFAAAGPPYTVLAIHWGAEDFVSAPVVNAAIRRALTSDPNIPIDYFVEYLESDVFDPGIASDSLAEYIRSKYQGRRIDVVVAVADAALRFVLDHRTQLFPAVPIQAQSRASYAVRLSCKPWSSRSDCTRQPRRCSSLPRGRTRRATRQLAPRSAGFRDASDSRI